jgi:tight adherence protein B
VSLPLVTVITFLAGAFVLAGVASLAADLVFRDRSRAAQRLDEEFLQRQRGRARKSPLFKDLNKRIQANIEGRAEAPPEPGWFQALVEQSGLEITPRRLLIIAGVVGAVLGVLAGVLTRSPVAGLLATAGGALLPVLYVRQRRNRRLDKLLGQLPDALDLMARTIRAGQTMSQALQAIADEFDPPIGTEFALCYEQQNLGLPPEMAFQDLARRTGLLELKIFILALLVQRQTGGNLAELLEKLATVVRERFRVRGKIRVLTAEGRVQAVVLLAMPPVIFLLMWCVNREYTQIILQHPNHLVGVGCSMAVGAWWIRRIVNFDF